MEGPTILKRLVHATGTGAGGLLDLGGAGKQPNGRWTTRCDLSLVFQNGRWTTSEAIDLADASLMAMSKMS